MTVETLNTTVSHIGDGIETNFSFDMVAYEESWIKAFINDIEVVINSVNLNSDQEAVPGGTVDLQFAVPNGQTVVIARVVDLTQTTDYPPYTRFPAQDHEEALDKLTMITQQQNASIVSNSNRILNLETNAIISDDPDAITIINPELIDDVTLQINTNVANGLVKLGADGLVPYPQLPTFYPGANPDLVDNDNAFNIGGLDPSTSLHLAFGSSVLQAKNGATGTGTLFINNLGGNVTIGTSLTNLVLNEITGDVSLRGATEITLVQGTDTIARSVAPNAGGLFVNNQATGGGEERVLTTSDFAAVAGNFFPGDDPDLLGVGAALIVGNNVPASEQHIEIGPTTIQAKADGTTTDELLLNPLGGYAAMGDIALANINVNPALLQVSARTNNITRMSIGNGATFFLENDFIANVTNDFGFLCNGGNDEYFRINRDNGQIAASLNHTNQTWAVYTAQGDATRSSALELKDNGAGVGTYNVRLSYSFNIVGQAVLESPDSVRVQGGTGYTVVSGGNFSYVQGSVAQFTVDSLNVNLNQTVNTDSAFYRIVDSADDLAMQLGYSSGNDEYTLEVIPSLNLRIETPEIMMLYAAQIEMEHGGGPAARTIPGFQGGLQAFNTATGGGFERVLTTSDLPPELLRAYRTNGLSRANTTTLATDPVLQLNLAAGTHYYFRAFLKFDSNGGGQRIDWVLPVGGVIDYEATYGVGVAGAESARAVGYSQTAGEVVVPHVVSINPIVLTGVVYGGNGGTFQLRWAQETSNASATELLGWSYIEAEFMDFFT